MMKYISFHFTCFCCLLVLVLFSSCGGKSKRTGFFDSDMYALSSPAVIDLPIALDEISGIAYYPKDTSVFAITDEVGVLYKIPIKDPAKFRQWKFDKGRDYEDIVLVDSTFFILVSNGDIHKISFSNGEPVAQKFDFKLQGKKRNEFESIYNPPGSDSLIMICKDCEENDKSELSTFSFNDRREAPFTKAQRFDMNPFVQKLGYRKHLKPSAAAINPVTGDLYVVSSILKSLVIFTHDNEFKELFKLDPEIYKQPEGIAFTPAGDLIISNEFADEGLPNLLIIKNKKK